LDDFGSSGLSVSFRFDDRHAPSGTIRFLVGRGKLEVVMTGQQLATPSHLGRAWHAFAWKLVLICGLLTATFVPFWRTELSQELAQFVIGLTSAVILLVTVIRSKTHNRTTWYWFSASAFSLFLGDTVWLVYGQILHLAVPFPSIADFFYICVYPFLFLGMKSMFGGHGRQRSYSDAIDAGIMVLGASAILWPVLIGPYLGSTGIGSLGVLTNVLYPLLDLALLFFIARFIIRRHLNPVNMAVVTAVAAMFFADITFDWSALNGSTQFLDLADGLHTIHYTLMAVAALLSVSQSHTATARVEKFNDEWVKRRPYRIPVLLVSGLIPAIIYVISVLNGGRVDGVALACISSALFLLVGARMHLLTTRLHHEAFHDHLTGLSNRAHLSEQLIDRQRNLGVGEGYSAIILIDLDDFKSLNDTLGHPMGDKMLCAVGERLGLRLRSPDIVFRIGGDEFVCLAKGLATREEANLIVERLLTAFSEPFNIGGVSVDQRACIGWYFWDGSDTPSNDALALADLALYAAKGSTTSRSQEFTPDLRSAVAHRFSLLQDLGRALPNGELSMHFQPIVNLQANSVVGFEALMRWRHPERGWVSPDDFIPVAEQSDLIQELGDFALTEAIATASSWPTFGPNDSAPFVTVNLSARQFQDRQLTAKIVQAMAHRDFFASRLVVEITEGIAMQNPGQTKEVIGQLTELGVSVAIDDFGSGHSSLATLIDINPAILKIDQSFIRPAIETIESGILLESIITLGQRLNMIVLAEGVETTSKNEVLKSYGCTLGQGFLWSPAMSPEEVRRYLASSPQRLTSELVPVASTR
jgi:diguanylate cyclase (GGDEF)-like protein